MIQEILLQVTTGISTGYRQWQTILANDHLSVGITLQQVVGEDVAQLSTCLGTHLDWHIDITAEVDVIHAICQLIDTRDVLGEVHRQVEGQILGLHWRTIEHQLDTLVGNLTGIDPLLGPRCRSIHEHRLVLGLRIIIGEVEAQTILQELHLQAPLEGRLDLWLQVAVLLDGLRHRHTNAILVGIGTSVVEVVRLRVLTYLGERQASLGKGNPLWERMLDATHEVTEDIADAGTWIEERAVVLRQGG